MALLQPFLTVFHLVKLFSVIINAFFRILAPFCFRERSVIFLNTDGYNSPTTPLSFSIALVTQDSFVRSGEIICAGDSDWILVTPAGFG